jgi:glycosyltransferase involved in cell wall biosynthesis
MLVYNDINFDGRVKRSIEALRDKFEIELLSVSFKDGVGSKNIYKVHPNFGSLNHLLFFLKAFLRSLFYRPQVIYAHDFFMAFPGFILAKVFRCRFIYDAHELIIPSQEYPQSKRDRFWSLLEKVVVHHADLILTANLERAERMKDFYGLKTMPTPIYNVSPNGPSDFNGDIVQHYPQLKAFKQFDFRFIYQGNIEVDRGLEPFFQAFQGLKDPYMGMLVVGSGPDFEKLRSLYQSENFIFLGKVPHQDLKPILAPKACKK